MTESYTTRTARAFYNVFLKDTARLMKALPVGLRLRLWSVMAILLGTGFLETLSLLCISVFALSIATPEAISDNFLLKPLLLAFPSLKEELLWSPMRIIALATSMMVLSIAIKNVSSILASRACSSFAERSVIFVCSEIVRCFMDRDYLWHINPESQETILKVMDRHRFSHYTLSLLLFYSNFVICICLFASLSFLEPALTFTVFAIFGSAALFLNRFFRRMADRSGAKSLLSVIEENRILTTLSRGIREIIIHRAQPFVDTGLSQVMFRGLAPRVAGGFLPYMPQQILESLGFATIVVMIVGMLALKLPMEEIVQTASLLMLTAWRILPAMSRCLTYSVELRRSRPVVMAYFDIWDDFLSEAGTHQPVPDPDFVFSQNLTLRDASFRYNNDFTDAISGVNLTVPKGSKVGLLGPSGSGKTSLALIMAGLVPPTEGEFLVDGKPLTAARREAYFRILGFVPQNPLILDGTLAENVAFSDWGSAGDEARVRRALKSVAADFVDEDPSGIEMLLSSAFRSLSGGQIQRVAIARAIYSDPQVIIFDEATSSLDHASENLIRRNLEQAGEEVTTVVITHSLSTVEFCDVVYWMEGGRIIRSGPPSEIIPLYVRDAELE